MQTCDLLKRFSSKAAEITAKPEQFVQVHLDVVPMLLMGGSQELCAKIEFGSIGLDTALEGGLQEFADTHGPTLATILTDHVAGLKPERVYVNLHAPAAASVVWDGKCFLTRRQEREAAASST